MKIIQEGIRFLKQGQNRPEEDLFCVVLAGDVVGECEFDDDWEDVVHFGEEGEFGHENVNIIIGGGILKFEI